ncbi:MAG: hypothetical protein IIZ78_22870 [Clostridiales bacterium]|nr:hypothetical protein [Clostridiales bacterium]
MTTELLENAKELDYKIKRYNGIMNDIRCATITYKERKKIVKCYGTSLDIEIPDELIQPIYDMLYAYYKRLASHAQTEFDILGE